MKVIKDDNVQYVLCLNWEEFDTVRLAVQDALQDHEKEDLYAPRTAQILEDLYEELCR